MHLELGMDTEFFVMPFNLTNAPATFMDLINKVSCKYLGEFVIVFANDILIYSNKEELHQKTPENGIAGVRESQLYTKFSKCDFWIKEVSFLGLNISKDGVVVDLVKVATVMEWKEPKNVTEV